MHRRQLLQLAGAALTGTALTGAALLSEPAAAVAGVRQDPSGGDELAGLLADEHAAGMPGLFAQVRYDDRAYRLAAGVADVTTGQPAQPGFRHRVGGITKSFVAVTVLQLVGERRLELDAPIGAYLPDVLPGDRGRQVTVRMLLNHTSGIPDFMRISLADGAGPAADLLFATRQSIADTATRRFSPGELVRMGLDRPPVGPPGAVWAYSNTNYVILGLLIERVTGAGYASEVTRRVLRPLNLYDSYLPGAQRWIRGAHLRAYVPWSDGTLRDFTAYDMSWAWASCDLVSSASDLNRFYRALLGGQLLEPGLLREMKTTVPMSPAYPAYAGYGLGLFWLAGPCGRSWGHDGLVIGHTTYSAHTEDGRTTQLTLAENLNFYESPAQRGTLPIDIARWRFESAVLSECGGTAAATPGVLWWPHIRDFVR